MEEKSAVSVKDYGAKGDGQADDTAAIERALRGAGTGGIDFPPGVYRVSRTIVTGTREVTGCAYEDVKAD